MSATTVEPVQLEAAAEPVQRLTYPISPDYVAGWTSERALAELVANAHDDDPGFSFFYTDGVLTIEDHGPGVPEEGLVLGWSSKRGADRDQYHGIWGEGLKVASLVLARDPAIGRVVVETVGYGFVPTVTTNRRLVPVGGRRATIGGTQLLAYDFFESDREVGTRVTVECSAKLAEAVRQRFLFLTDPNYVPPPEHGRVLDMPGGRLYIGGVFVDTNPKLLFSYDFNLASAKRFQNRDRTVLDANELDGLIHGALSHLSDPVLVERWVQTALTGKLYRAEQYFTQNGPPEQRRVMRALAKRMFAGRKVMWSDGREDEEAVLDLRDRGYEVLQAQALPGYAQYNLFAALGIKQARVVQRRPPARQKTVWVARKDLTTAETSVLDEALRIVRGAYGVSAVGACDIYESTCLEGVDDDLRWGGFYEPRGGRIGIQRRNLADLAATLDVLVHEAGHRLRHRSSRWDFADRTRGFEWQLGTMATKALMLAAGGGIPDSETLTHEAARAAAEEAEREAERARHPASMVRAVLAARMAASGLNFEELADECGVSVGTLRQLRVGQYRNYGGHRHPDGTPQLYRTRAVCEKLGLEWGIVQLALLSESIWMAPYHDSDSGRTIQPGLCRRQRKMSQSDSGSGRITGTRGDEIQNCILRLQADRIRPRDHRALQEQLDHSFDGSDGAWLDPVPHPRRNARLKS